MIPSFGQLPSGKRLSRIRSSPNYREGAFQNVYDTPMLGPDASYPKMLAKFFFGSTNGQEPSQQLPSVKPDFRALSREETSITWFGHSSYLLTLNGKIILVDPVFSQRPSPFQYVGSRAFGISSPFSVDDLPDPDLVILTHDHYDHLDHRAIQRLAPRVPLFATSLGVGAHLEYWGVPAEKIKEFDWWESAQVIPGIELTALPARHFSGRGFKRNQVLWSAFMLAGGGVKIFVGGDSGYDSTFGKIGDLHGPVDFAILECGQYDAMWPHIHMFPEQTVQAGLDLRAKSMMAVHWGKFRLANHAWTDPIERAHAEAGRLQVNLVTPMIGAKVNMVNPAVATAGWWRNITGE
jgi:L-ascorbate metabolism protein UlaG (beta-lactamase superfamily)